MNNPVDWIAREFSEDIAQALLRNKPNSPEQNEAVKEVIYRAEGHAYWQGYQDAASWAANKVSVGTIEQNLLRAAKESEITIMIPYAYTLGVRAGLRGQNDNQTPTNKLTIKQTIMKKLSSWKGRTYGVDQ